MDFHLPQLGEGVYEAEMVRWLVAPGDPVKPGQGLMEVMTDKATMEVPAPFGGTVTELRVQPGGSIKVGDLILTYSAGGPVPEDIGPPAPAAKALPMEGDPLNPAARRRNGPPRGGEAAGAVKASPSVRQLARK